MAITHIKQRSFQEVSSYIYINVFKLRNIERKALEILISIPYIITLDYFRLKKNHVKYDPLGCGSHLFPGGHGLNNDLNMIHSLRMFPHKIQFF